MYRHILVATDFEPRSTRAAKQAIALAAPTGARVTALHVIPPFMPPPYLDYLAPAPELYSVEHYERSTRRYAKRMLAKLEALARARKVKLDSAFVTGAPPWEAILRAARAGRCDLVVMASHGRHGIAGALLGSETAKVLSHSKIPVLVCR